MTLVTAPAARNNPEAILSSDINKISQDTLRTLFQYARANAVASGTIITAAENEISPSRIIDANGKNITSECAPFFSSHTILNYQNNHYIMLKPSIYSANQDNPNNPNDPLNRGSREVLLLKNEAGEIFTAKIITASSVIKDRVLQSATNEIQLAHQFSNAPHDQCVTTETNDGESTQIYLLQYYKGVCLQEALYAGFLSFEQKANIATQILKIILNIQAKGYLHRDIQRHNFVIAKNEATGLYDVSLVDYGKAVKFDPQTGEEYSTTSTHSNSKHSVLIDMQKALTEIYELFPENNGSDNYCMNIIEMAKEEMGSKPTISSANLSKPDNGCENIHTIIKNTIANIEEASKLFALKAAVREIVQNYKNDCAKNCCFLLANRKHGWIGRNRANKLQQACEAAQDIASIQLAFNQCFSPGCFSKPRTNDHSLIRYVAANQTLVNAFQLKETIAENQSIKKEYKIENLIKLGENNYSFWNNTLKKHAKNQKNALKKISSVIKYSLTQQTYKQQ